MHEEYINEHGTKAILKSHSLASDYTNCKIPLVSFLHPMRSTTSQWLAVPIILTAGFLARWAVGLGSYSGFNAPPTHGDFEAQRHWMEITIHLPMKHWYWHDLKWWGLDYPPLTAYHSYVLGKIGNHFDPQWFKLYESRGLDDSNLKVFMRATVILSEYVTYIPAIVSFINIYGKISNLSRHEKVIALAAMIFNPAIMMIDHGHFQYNSVMFGLTFAAMNCFLTDQLLWGSLFYVMALCFKQMALYYAPVIFAYLLGLSLFPKINLKRICLLGTTVIATFFLIFSPLYVSGGPSQITQCLHRLFPFARGLWEDKVANFWCASNVLIKYKEKFSATTLQKASFFATLVGILPSCAITFLYPQKKLLPISLSSCAWSFFLFSFQVHEKSVLLPLLPASAMVAGSLDQENVCWIAWMNNVAMFSLWPLLRRDGLALQYFVTTIFYAWLVGTFDILPKNRMAKSIHCLSYLAMFSVHIAESAYGKVEKYPDLWVVCNVLISCAAYFVAWFWTLSKLWSEKEKPKLKNQ